MVIRGDLQYRNCMEKPANKIDHESIPLIEQYHFYDFWIGLLLPDFGRYFYKGDDGFLKCLPS